MELSEGMPNDVVIEKAVLGAILLQGNVISELFNSGLIPEHFYDPKNVAVYKAMLELFVESVPIDLMTVWARLRTNDTSKTVGTAGYITSLTNDVATASNAIPHSALLRELYLRRWAMSFSMRLNQDALDMSKDVFEILSEATTVVEDMITSRVTRQAVNFEEAKLPMLDLIEQRIKDSKAEKEIGFPFGISPIDDFGVRLEKGHVTIIGARPGIGKSYLAQMISIVNAKAHANVLFASLEMSANDLLFRITSTLTKINSRKLTSGRTSETDMHTIQKTFQEVRMPNFHIVDNFNMNVNAIASVARKHSMKVPLDILVIDYLQLVSNTPNAPSNREQQVALISRSLKYLAKELDCSVVALSQLSRDPKGLQKEPALSDLRESGSLEQDASQVVLMYDAFEVYGNDIEGGHSTRPEGENGNVKLIGIKMPKNRSDKTFSTFSYLDLTTSTYYTIDEYYASKQTKAHYTPPTEQGSMQDHSGRWRSQTQASEFINTDNMPF